MKSVAEKVLAGMRISGDEFLKLSQSNDLHHLGFLADSVCRRLHPEPIVTYVVDRNIIGCVLVELIIECDNECIFINVGTLNPFFS